MRLGLRFLGFLIPTDILLLAGGRDRTPGRGVCAICDEPRELTYLRWDRKRVCVYCLALLADVKAKEQHHLEQHHPARAPIEGISIPPDAIPPVYERTMQA